VVGASVVVLVVVGASVVGAIVVVGRWVVGAAVVGTDEVEVTSDVVEELVVVSAGSSSPPVNNNTTINTTAATSNAMIATPHPGTPLDAAEPGGVDPGGAPVMPGGLLGSGTDGKVSVGSPAASCMRVGWSGW